MATDILLMQADARHIPLADESVQCVVTSPPYWGLRKYSGAQDLVWDGAETHAHVWMEETKPGISGGLRGVKADYEPHRFVPASINSSCECGAWRGAFGLEPTIDLYIAHTLAILRELRRVLRADGVVFWNIGDSYHSARGYGGDLKPNDLQSSNRGSLRGKDTYCPNRFPYKNLKPKDLCLIPARVAIAAQADGWWIRSLIIWVKPNPMPESVTDRPTDTYEHIIMLTKSERYFWDADAVREPHKPDSHNPEGKADRQLHNGAKGAKMNEEHRAGNNYNFRAWAEGGRNIRNVWTFATQPYKGAHFATFPEELPRRCILAATSAKGACIECGAPWERVVKASGGTSGKGSWTNKAEREEKGKKWRNSEVQSAAMDGTYRREAIGWRPTCRCRGQHGRTAPCLVLDPFAGSGTTGRVAVQLNRRATLIDLAYHDHADRRARNVQRELIFAPMLLRGTRRRCGGARL